MTGTAPSDTATAPRSGRRLLRLVLVVALLLALLFLGVQLGISITGSAAAAGLVASGGSGVPTAGETDTRI